MPETAGCQHFLGVNARLGFSSLLSLRVDASGRTDYTADGYLASGSQLQVPVSRIVSVASRIRGLRSLGE